MSRDPWKTKRYTAHYTIAAVGVGLIALASCSPDSAPPAPQPTTITVTETATPSPTRSIPITPQPSTPSLPPVQPPVNPAQPILDVAANVVTAWMASDIEAVRRDSTTEFADLTATIDAALLPTSPVVETRLVAEADEMARVAVLLEDGFLVNADMVLQEGRWLVTDLVPGA